MKRPGRCSGPFGFMMSGNEKGEEVAPFARNAHPAQGQLARRLAWASMGEVSVRA